MGVNVGDLFGGRFATCDNERMLERERGFEVASRNGTGRQWVADSVQ
jgi:hypothetical protein